MLNSVQNGSRGQTLWLIACRATLGSVIGLASMCLLAACGATSPAGGVQVSGNTNTSNTTSSSQMNVASASSPSTSDDGSWRTISESSISSVSSGGGSNSSDSQSSVSVHGAYQVLAACEGSGALDIALRPGGSVTVHCSADEGDPSRVAGSDSAPPGAVLSLDVRPSGNVSDADILVQERV